MNSKDESLKPETKREHKEGNKMESSSVNDPSKTILMQSSASKIGKIRFCLFFKMGKIVADRNNPEDKETEDAREGIGSREQ